MISRPSKAKSPNSTGHGKMGSKDTIQNKEQGFNSPAALPRRRHFWFLFLIFCIGFLFAGCEEGTPTLAPVSGRVSYQNQLLPRGAAVVVPDADRGNNGRLAQGSIQSGGAYTIQTDGKPGAMPGWYRVTVIAVEEALAGYYRPGASIPRSLVPEKYRDPQLSDLT